jgi:hypothetical protein
MSRRVAKSLPKGSDSTPKTCFEVEPHLRLPTSLACGNRAAEMRCRSFKGRETHRSLACNFRIAAFTLRLVVREFVRREEHFYSSSSFSTISNSRWSSVDPPGTNPAARFGPRGAIVQAISYISSSVDAFFST